jgi:glutamine---fructose-6-phosphate transaminase (isomerizing)
VCGIVGYVGPGDARTIVVEGLRRLEYRGYDSCGVAVPTPKGLERRRTVGPVANLDALVKTLPKAGLALGHTRWATHGGVTEENAHPHTDCGGRLALVHNGVIENFAELKAGLKGHTFRSETDTEVIAHLIESHFKGDLLEATRAALERVRGTFALVAIHLDLADTIVFARRGPPLLVGLGKGFHLVASDPTAVLGHTRDVVYLEDGEVGRVTRTQFTLETLEGRPVKRDPVHIEWTPEQAERGGFPHYMLKEIYESPKAVRETTLGRLSITPPHVRFEGLPDAAHWAKLTRVRLLSIGSSYYAGLIGKHLIETLAGVPCEATLASEYRNSPQVEEKGTLAIVITQSGETADTLGALREAKRRGLETLAIVNVEGSTATREAHHVLLTKAGPEIGVASTKTYLAQVAALALLAIHLGEATRRKDSRELRHAANLLKQVPHALDLVLQTRDALRELARKTQRATSLFFLGRGANHASAFEAALKFKEIAYVHGEGYASGELKHGPFALLTKKTPVFAFLQPDHLMEKQIGSLMEVRARGAPVYGLCLGPPGPWADYCEGLVSLPEVDPLVSPLVFGLASHLLAYEAAALKGHPIDKPRHLAKSVTVE